jgi:hypothetical protein
VSEIRSVSSNIAEYPSIRTTRRRRRDDSMSKMRASFFSAWLAKRSEAGRFFKVVCDGVRW